MKNNKKIYLIFLIIIVVIAALFSLCLLNKKPKKEVIIEKNCTKKGNVCTHEEIYEGVAVSVEVTKGNSQKFYVIANDENTMTLLLADDLKKGVDWQVEGINFKGPNTALYNILLETDKWEIPVIKNYVYEDYGNLYRQNLCKSGFDKYYDCTIELGTHPGYKNYEIKDGIVTFNFNLDSTASEGEEVITSMSYNDMSAKARLVTIEELEEVSNDSAYPNWLIENLDSNEGYWTASSATTMNVNYYYGAYAVVNKDGKTSVDSVYATNKMNDEKINIRPVITVEKK